MTELTSDRVTFTYVESDEFLAKIADQLNQTSVIAVDTEFARFNTYYPIVGLVQIYDGNECFLIDPLAVSNLDALTPVFSNPEVLKVFHAGSEDMEVFQHCIQTIPAPIFDTQIASAALGVGFSVGYQGLVERYLDISLPKDQTRSDWLQRPLSADQQSYAALDVIHLLQVYEKQVADLRESGKLEWVMDESSALGKDIPTLVSPSEFYLKIKGLWRLDRKELNVMQALCAWREMTARQENVPRNRVVDQKALMIIVRDHINTRPGLQNEAEMTPRQVRKYGDEVLLIQAEARMVGELECPPLVTKPDSPVNNKLMKRLKKVVEERAAFLSVAPELLIKRRHLEKLIRSEDADGRYHLPGELDGWRESAIGDALLTALSE